MRRLFAIALILSLHLSMQFSLPAQEVIGVKHRKAKGTTCLAPTMTYRWPMWGTGNTCNGGSACTNGAGLDTVVDVVDSNNLTQSSAGSRPIYTTGEVNGLAAAVFSGSDVFNMATSFPFNSGTTQATLLVILKPSSLVSELPMMGHIVSGALEWRINNLGHQELLVGGIGGNVSGTHVFSTIAYQAAVLQVNEVGDTYAFFVCSGGTCTSDGSGSFGNYNLVNAATELIGFQNPDGNYSGGIAEFSYHSALSTTGIGAYVQCKYGI